MTERVPASFRDPAGFIFRRDGQLYRQVNDRHRDNYDAMMTGGLYDALIEHGLLIPHSVADVAPADPTQGSLVLRPETVAFISYPYEWAPGQLQAAAEATLRIQQIALGFGMTLRDASAYNIQFHHGRPILIDTLSFEPLVEGRPWVAYGQFCRHFIAPLALMKYVDVRLGSLLRTEIDGVPLDLAARALPSRTRFTWGLGVHLHAHAASQKRHADDGEATGRVQSVSLGALKGLVESLLGLTRKLGWEPPESTWRDYYPKAESYTEDASLHKRDVVASMLEGVEARTVWDLGANTGQFSRLAAELTGASVLAVEMDPSAVELHWRDCQREGNGDVLPLLNDLANPTPAQGWAHRERDSLEGRGPADVVLALALVHHLAIGNNVPLSSVMEWFSRLGRSLIVEWIPKEDPMVVRLLASREDVFDAYTTDEFEAAVKEWFDIKQQIPLEGSLRCMYLLERR